MIRIILCTYLRPVEHGGLPDGVKKTLDRAREFDKFDALLLALLGPHFLFRQKTANFTRVLIAKGDNTQLDAVAKPATHCPRHEDVDS